MSYMTNSMFLLSSNEIASFDSEELSVKRTGFRLYKANR
jgi:hypothetical protein